MRSQKRLKYFFRIGQAFEQNIISQHDFNIMFQVDPFSRIYDSASTLNSVDGVMENETTETSTSGCGSLILGMGALSRLIGDPKYESAALCALRELWGMWSSLNLLGTTLDISTGEWIVYSSGIGAGDDYLFKGHILVGNEFWRMFHSAVQKYFRHGPWLQSFCGNAYYHEADMRTGKATYWQLTSLQAFWRGLQGGNLKLVILLQCIEKVWSNTREVFVGPSTLHPTEKYYPLRPELAESTFDLYQATKCPWYIEVGESILNSLNLYTKVERGFANIRDVTTMQLEDHQHNRKASAMCVQVCPPTTMNSWECGGEQVESACHVPDDCSDHRCLTDDECGIYSTNCRRRWCGLAGYCGLWLFI
ncbi:hypothetical protein FF2_038549 [Malus domestica]